MLSISLEKEQKLTINLKLTLKTVIKCNRNQNQCMSTILSITYQKLTLNRVPLNIRILLSLEWKEFRAQLVAESKFQGGNFQNILRSNSKHLRSCIVLEVMDNFLSRVGIERKLDHTRRNSHFTAEVRLEINHLHTWKHCQPGPAISCSCN